MEVLVRAFTVPIGRKEGPAAIGLSCGFCCAFWLYDRYAHESSVPDSDSPCAWYVCVYIYIHMCTHTHISNRLCTTLLLVWLPKSGVCGPGVSWGFQDLRFAGPWVLGYDAIHCSSGVSGFETSILRICLNLGLV